jgi:hypothetical protein
LATMTLLPWTQIRHQIYLRNMNLKHLFKNLLQLR